MATIKTIIHTQGHTRTHNSNMYSNAANVFAERTRLLAENAILLKKLRDGEKEKKLLEKKLAQETIKVAKKQLVDTSKAQKAISKALAAEDRRVAKNVVKEAKAYIFHRNIRFIKQASTSTPPKEEICKMEKYKLQIYLAKYKLPVSGDKPALVARLENYLYPSGEE